jgi:hypothetical protein
MSSLRRLLAALPALALGAAAWLASGSAAAYEHQWHAGASFGYSALFADQTYNGFGGGLHLTYGANDTVNLLAEIEATYYPGKWSVVSGGLGAAYVLDVLQWVPWGGIEVGPAGLLSLDPKCGTACTAFRFSAAIPFGLDYQISRSFTVGLGGRFQVLLLGATPWETLTVAARAEYVWGY